MTVNAPMAMNKVKSQQSEHTVICTRYLYMCSACHNVYTRPLSAMWQAREDALEQSNQYLQMWSG